LAVKSVNIQAMVEAIFFSCNKLRFGCSLQLPIFLCISRRS